MNSNYEKEMKVFLFNLSHNKITNLLAFKQSLKPYFFNIQNFKSELLVAIIFSNNMEIFNYSLNHYTFNINHLYSNNYTILQLVSENLNLNYDMATKLLNYQTPNVNIIDDWGNNPIWNTLYRQSFNNSISPEAIEWIKDLLLVGFKPTKSCKKYIKKENNSYLFKLLTDGI